LSLRWGKVDDPDAFVQRLLYQPALSRWARVRPFEGEEEPVKLALATLTPAQRTVLVLLYLEELTEFEVADVLSMSQPSVHGHGLTALGRLGAELGSGDWRDANRRDQS
jgi:DNA-directed RNA polymerase specialized sigma24 family protein